MKVVRVFPRRTKMTPADAYAFVGDPPLIRPEVNKVHISATFTWDIPEALRLARAWGQYYKTVHVGGPAFGSPCNGFEPGIYVKKGVTFTSRGCNNNCWFCLAKREGRIKLLPIRSGHIIQDNNLLQTGRRHIAEVFDMLKAQRRSAVLSGGLDSTLVDDWVAEQLRGLRIDQLFLSCDSYARLKPLQKAVKRLSFLPRRKLRCYVLIGTESLQEAEDRLRAIWEIGCLPFAQLYQPPEQYIDYSPEWKRLARTWSRPAAMFARMASDNGDLANMGMAREIYRLQVEVFSRERGE